MLMAQSSSFTDHKVKAHLLVNKYLYVRYAGFSLNDVSQYIQLTMISFYSLELS